MARAGRKRKKPVTLAPVSMAEVKSAEGSEDISDEIMKQKGHVRRRIRRAIDVVAPFLSENQKLVVTDFYHGCFSLATIGRQVASYDGSVGGGGSGKEPFFDEDAARDRAKAGYILSYLKENLPLHTKTAVELIVCAEAQAGRQTSMVDHGKHIAPSIRCQRKLTGVSIGAMRLVIEQIEHLSGEFDKKEALRLEMRRKAHAIYASTNHRRQA